MSRMLWWPAWCGQSDGQGKLESLCLQSWRGELQSVLKCSGGLHDVAEIVMQLVSGRGRGNAAFWTSTSSFLDLEVQSGVELFFILIVVGLHTVEKDQLQSPLSASQ